jgi:hypothetical protein
LKLKPGLLLTIAAAMCGVAAAQEYDGPTVLSRGGGGIHPYGEQIGEDPKLRVYVEATAIYDYGFTPVSVNSTGAINSLGGQFGYEGHLGVYGTKRWRRTSLGLDYNGEYRGYTKNTYYNGADNFLGLEFGDQLDRKSLLTGTITAGTSSRVFGAVNNLIGVPLGNILPTTDIFDARTYFLNGGMGISRQLTSRLGFEIRADAFRVERHSTALISVQGYSPKASLSYRLNKRDTIGAIYNFIHYDYPRAFGEADIHVAMGFWTHQINQLWKFEVQGGTFVANSAGTQTIAADPVVQQLLGVSQITEAFSRVVTLPNGQLSLNGRSGNSTFTLSVYRGAGAGNGLTLASSQQTASMNYGYVFSKRLTGGIHANYSSAVGLTSSADRYSVLFAGVDAQYHAGTSLVYTFHGDYRKAEVTSNTNFAGNAFQIGLGIGWSLKDLPFIH